MRSVLSVSLPENISSELDKFARSTGRTKSDIVKESINLYLWEARFRRLQKRVGAKAKKARLGQRRGCVQGHIVRAVFDTNVLVTSFVSEGVCSKLLIRARKRQFHLFISPSILQEFERVLVRKLAVLKGEARDAVRLVSDAAETVVLPPGSRRLSVGIQMTIMYWRAAWQRRPIIWSQEMQIFWTCDPFGILSSSRRGISSHSSLINCPKIPIR